MITKFELVRVVKQSLMQRI